MHRRTFCGLIPIAAASSFIPFSGCSSPDPVLAQQLSLPLALATMSDTSTIIELGKAYVKATPKENTTKILIEKLLSDADNEIILARADSLKMKVFLEQQVRSDFERGNTVTLSGWILSITEARQCALFSLTQTTDQHAY